MPLRATNRNLARRFYEPLSRGDPEAAGELVGISYRHNRITDSGFASASWDDFKEGFLHVRSAFPDWTLEPIRLIAEDDSVAAIVIGSGTHAGTFAGEPPTQQVASLPLITVHRIEDGLLAEDWEATDPGPMMQRLARG